MDDGVERFVSGVPAVESAESVVEGRYLHVYHGTMADIDEPVRFLTLAPERDDERVVEAFAETARNWQTAGTHPNVVTAFDNGSEPRPWVATERVDDGRSLNDARSDLAPGDIRTIIEGIAEALRAARLYNARPPVLTPEHVRVVPADDGVTALVEDWGLERACRVAADDSPASPYIPPERLEGKPRTERSSVYEFGALSYYLLTGSPPLQSGDGLADRVRSADVTPPSDHIDLLPDAVDAVVLQALSTDPEERQGSAQAVKRDLLRELPDVEESGGTDRGPTVSGPGATTGDDGSADGEEKTDAETETATEGGIAWGRTAALGLVGVVVVVLLLGGVLFVEGSLLDGGGGSPSFDVEVVETNAPVTAGDPLNVTVAVENVGDAEGTERVELTGSGLGSDSTEVSLGGGESTTATLTLETGEGDAGDYAASVSAGDDTASATVSIEESAPPDFEVNITGTNAPVTAGETLTVDATIANIGGRTGEQRVVASVGPVGEDSKQVSLAGGESTERTFAVETAPDDIGEQIMLVSGGNRDSRTVSIESPAGRSPANFQVVLEETNTPLTAGGTISVEAAIANTGDFETTQFVTLDVDGLGSDSAAVTLAGGESTGQTFTVETGPDDAGEYNVTVSSDDDTDSQQVTVAPEDAPLPGTLKLSIAETNAPVTAGGAVEVTAALENPGETAVEQAVVLDAGDLGTDAVDVTLGGGETTERTLSVATESGGAGEYTVTVVSEDDTASTTVTVEEESSSPDPAAFALSVAGTNAPVTEGETLSVEAAVENTGDAEGTTTVTMSVDGIGTESASVTLADGASTVETFSLETSGGDAGQYTVGVSAGDGAASTTVTVQEAGGGEPDAATFGVDIAGTNGPVTAGEGLSVEVTVENTGGATGEATVSLDAGALGGDSTTVSLAAGASTTETLTVGTESGDAGEYTATVEVGDDTATEAVTVESGGGESAALEVSIQETNAPVTEGETLEVTASIENTGGASGEATVTLDAGGLGGDSVTVSLAAGASTTETLTVGTESGDAGEYTATVEVGNDTTSTTVTVGEPTAPNLVVSVQATNAPVTEGETLEVTASIENTGGESDTQTVSLDAGALGEDASSVTLTAGQSTTETFTVGTESGDAGEYTATVTGENDTASTDVTVEEPASPNFAVSITETNSPVTAGETLEVTVTVENTGDASGEATVTLSIVGLGDDSTQVSLAPSDSAERTLSVETSSGDAGDYPAQVEADGDTDGTQVTVNEASQSATAVRVPGTRLAQPAPELF